MNDYKAFAERMRDCGKYSGKILFDELMAQHTTFKVGGSVPVFFEPADYDSLINLLTEIKKAEIKFFVLGGGSNIVFADSGFDGVVISLCKLDDVKLIDSQAIYNQFKNSESFDFENDSIVTCGAGTSMAKFVNFCTQNRLSGAEVFAGLPGTVGGALFMNARCFNVSVSDIFVEAYYINLEDFTEQHKIFDAKDWKYKVSPFQNSKCLLLSASFHLKKTEKSVEEINLENRKYIDERKEKGHFQYPSAGSVFRNNRSFGSPSGKIIDDCGLKGTRIGNAQIASFHGNFIINLGGATQKDIKSLVEFTVNTVKEKTGFILEPEIIFVD